MVNTAKFLKGYHNRVYFYSSGTILARVSHRLKRYMLKLNSAVDNGEEENEEEENEEEESVNPPPMDAAIMIRKVVYIPICDIHTHVHLYKHSTRRCSTTGNSTK